jgi:hypothetical protein
MSSNRKTAVLSVIGIDIGKNSFHVVGQDQRGAIVLRQKWSRGQVEARLADLPPCLIGMEACVGAVTRVPLSRRPRLLRSDSGPLTNWRNGPFPDLPFRLLPTDCCVTPMHEREQEQQPGGDQHRGHCRGINARQ